MWKEGEEQHIMNSGRSFTNYKKSQTNKDIYSPEIHLAFQVFIFHWQSSNLEKKLSIFLSMEYQLDIKIFASEKEPCICDIYCICDKHEY